MYCRRETLGQQTRLPRCAHQPTAQVRYTTDHRVRLRHKNILKCQAITFLRKACLNELSYRIYGLKMSSFT